MSKVVVVTGGSAGIGRAAARTFARRGDSVAVLARESSRLDETCRELEALGSPVLAYDAQQEDGEELQPEQPDNLFEPVPLAVGATGRFGGETHTRAVRVPAPLARGALVVSAVAVAAGLAALGRASKNGS